MDRAARIRQFRIRQPISELRRKELKSRGRHTNQMWSQEELDSADAEAEVSNMTRLFLFAVQLAYQFFIAFALIAVVYWAGSHWCDLAEGYCEPVFYKWDGVAPVFAR